MPISAIRAFLMASLVIGALMLDRLALTLRNVALAALVILLVNPLALLTAGFQLSLSATLALVLWYEALMRARVIGSDGVSGTDGTPRWPKPVRYLLGLVTTSLIAGFATMPFAAQHFGGVTAWGVLANIFGIPLTGLWIMPAGLLATIVHALPFPLWLDQLSLVVMETGIMMLVAVAGFFADQPYAGWRVIPPGYGLLCLGLFGWLITMLDRNTRWQKICGSGVSRRRWC
jgi:competence protein ComEC